MVACVQAPHHVAGLHSLCNVLEAGVWPWTCIIESPRGKQCYRPCQPHAHAGAAAARRPRELARQCARLGRRALADPVGSAPSLTLGLPRRRWRSASRRWWSRRWRPRWAGATANARASWPRCWPAAGAARTLRACTPPRACPRCRRARGVARPHFLGGPLSALAAPAAAGWHGGHACRVCSGRCRCSLRPAAHETSQPGLTGSVAADGGWTAAPWQPTAQAAGLKRRRCGTNTRTGRWRPGCRASTRAWRRPRRPRRAGPRARCQTSTRRCRCACSPRCSRAWTGPAARGWRPRSRPVRQLPRPATAAAPAIRLIVPRSSESGCTHVLGGRAGARHARGDGPPGHARTETGACAGAPHFGGAACASGKFYEPPGPRRRRMLRRAARQAARAAARRSRSWARCWATRPALWPAWPRSWRAPTPGSWRPWRRPFTRRSRRRSSCAPAARTLARARACGSCASSDAERWLFALWRADSLVSTGKHQEQ